MDDSRFSITPQELYRSLCSSAAPLVVDVRRSPAYEGDERVIAGAIRRPPDDDRWLREPPRGRPIVVYCVHGREVGREAAAALRANGVHARYLEGGIVAWIEQRLPTRRKDRATGCWVTRDRPKVDRVACPWLVRRFVDPEAGFLYVPADRVFEVAREAGAIPFDIPGAEPFSHDGERCSFDGFLKAFDIADPALDRLATIVRGADTGRPDLAPQAAGLLAVSLGLSAHDATDDHAMLEHAMVVYDALYLWCRSQDQPHPAKP